MKKQNFIETTDYLTALALKKAGFQEIKSSIPNVYTFINSTSANFSDVDTSKIKYSNILCI